MEICNFSANRITDDVRGNGFKYMTYGDEDTFPDELLDLYKNSSLHHTLIESTAQLIAGDGLYSEDNEFNYKYFTSNLDEDLDEIFTSASKEIKLHGYCYIEVIKKSNSMLLNVIPAQYVRNGAHKMLQSPTEFYVNVDPDTGRNFSEMLHTFDGRRKHSMLYIKRPDTTTRSYSEPDYIGATNDILLDYHGKRHKLNSVQNGFMPSTVMTLDAGNHTEEQRNFMEKKIISKYTGSESQNRVMVVWKEGDDKPVELDSFEPGNVVEFFKELGPETLESILIAHRVSSPALFGLFLNVSSGMGNNDEELKTAYSIFMETVVKPYQKLLLKGFQKLIDFSGQNMTLAVNQLNPGIMDIDEHTEDETSETNTKFNLFKRKK